MIQIFFAISCTETNVYKLHCIIFVFFQWYCSSHLLNYWILVASVVSRLGFFFYMMWFVYTKLAFSITEKVAYLFTFSLSGTQAVQVKYCKKFMSFQWMNELIQFLSYNILQFFLLVANSCTEASVNKLHSIILCFLQWYWSLLIIIRIGGFGYTETWV